MLLSLSQTSTTVWFSSKAAARACGSQGPPPMPACLGPDVGDLVVGEVQPLYGTVGLQDLRQGLWHRVILLGQPTADTPSGASTWRSVTPHSLRSTSSAAAVPNPSGAGPGRPHRGRGSRGRSACPRRGGRCGAASRRALLRPAAGGSDPSGAKGGGQRKGRQPDLLTFLACYGSRKRPLPRGSRHGFSSTRNREIFCFGCVDLVNTQL